MSTATPRVGMQTPTAVYQPSPRKFPSRVPEPEHPETMLVRTVRAHGHFRWKQHDVFLSEVLWGENVGLLPDEDPIVERNHKVSGMCPV